MASGLVNLSVSATESSHRPIYRFILPISHAAQTRYVGTQLRNSGAAGESRHMSSRSGASTGTSEMVPRQLLLDSQDTVERLRRQLDDALANQDSEVNVAVHTLQAQLRAVQKQQKAAEAQLNRSMAREKELREQVVNADVMSKITRICIHTHTHAHTHYLHNTRSRAREHTSTHIHTQVVNADVMSAMSSLRNENKELREQNEKLSEQATKGQEGEAQLIVLRNKLEASREELQRVRSGNELELQSTRMEAAALKKALQQAEIDQIRSEQVLRREKEMQETIDRFAAQLNEKDRQVLQCCSPASRVRTRIAHLKCRDPITPLLRAQILELQDELDRASSTVAASTGEAHSRGEKVADLERRLRHEKNRSEEVICIQDRACVCLACRNLDALHRFTCHLHFLSRH